MFQTSRTTKRLLCSFGALLAIAGAVRAQNVSPDYEVGILAGGSFFKQHDDPLNTELRPSGKVEAILTENFSNYLGTEQSFAYMQNRLQLHPSPQGITQNFDLAQHQWQFQESLLLYARPKESIVRPYFEVGFGTISYRPTDGARAQLSLPVAAPFGGQDFQSDTKFLFTYGGGVKIRMSNHIGIRGGIIGLVGKEPHYGLSQTGSSPQLTIPGGGINYGIQASAGVSLIFGRAPEVAVIVVAAPGFAGVTIQPSSPAAVCANTPVSFTATVDAVSPNHTPSYRWTVDGQNAGTNSTSFSYTPTGAGSHTIGLTVTDNITQLVKQAAPVTLTVNEHSAPTITANADKTDLQVGDKAMLYPHPQAGNCPGTLTVSWTASDGAVTGTDPATFDSSTVSFDSNNPAAQTKQVTVTATVTDSAGGSASAPVTINVNKQPTFVRQDDIIFPTSNSRVNNCGKRLLIDVVYPALTSGQYQNYDVILVGHMGNEPPAPAAKGRRNRRRGAAAEVTADLATERAQHAAEILASGLGICPKPGIDTSRIKIATVGPNQGAEFKKPICAASIKERRASRINESDDMLKDQRVEIWFVPKGATPPPSAANAQTAPDTMKSVCPK
jgi:hypothetical protein